jgi:hypothetical protein
LPPADDAADFFAALRFLVAAAFLAAADLSAFVCAMKPPVVVSGAIPVPARTTLRK